MFPVRKEQGGEATLDRDANQLNMIFIMIDSVSHSTAERYLKKTLKKMKASKSTIIMNVRLTIYTSQGKFLYKYVFRHVKVKSKL